MRGGALSSSVATRVRGRDLPALGLAAGIALAAGLAVVVHPAGAPVLILLVGGAILWVALGPESVAGVAALAATGFIPFLDVETRIGPIPLWTVGFLLMAGIALAAWLGREAIGRRTGPLRSSFLLAMVLLFGVYSVTRLALTDPPAIPSATAALSVFAPSALVGFLVFSQPRAIESLRRLLPFAAVLFLVWSVALVGGATGQCTPCVDFVVSESERPGLAGGESRLYTAGGESVPTIALLALGAAIGGAVPALAAVAVAGIVDVAYAAFRAQYLALAGGIAVLLAWRFRRAGLNGRMVLLGATVVLLVIIALSAVGARALSGYQELQSTSGTAGFRLRVLDQAAQTWTLFGQGGTLRSEGIGFHYDLGILNTLHAFGYLGALLQLTVFGAAIVRAVRYGGWLGMSLAAVFTFVLLGRPSLPLVEYGPSAIVYGLAVGAACALPVEKWRPRGRDPARRARVAP